MERNAVTCSNGGGFPTKRRRELPWWIQRQRLIGAGLPISATLGQRFPIRAQAVQFADDINDEIASDRWPFANEFSDH